MRRRMLGTTGIEVSEIGIGTWELSGDAWGAKDDRSSLEAIRAGLESGANLVDTAADYGSGHVEELLGTLVAGGRRTVRRDDLVLATKVRPQSNRWAPPPKDGIAEHFSPRWIRAECEASLRRLRTDHVDVLLLHTWSRSWGHEDDWFGEMARLKEEGKIRAIGISVPDRGASDANVQIARGQVDVVQCVHSVFQQEPEATLFPLAHRFGVGVMARSPFSSGALVQRWHAAMRFPSGDWRGSWPGETTPGWLDDQVRMAEIVRSIIVTTGLDEPTFCLRYVLGHPAVSSVIPGSANPAHVRSNMAVSAEPGLDTEVLGRLRDLWQSREIHGTFNGSG